MEVNTDTLWAFFGSMGLATIVVAAINAFSNRRKTGADATKTITDAALGVVTELRSSLKDAVTQVKELERREDERDVRDAERDRKDRVRARNLARHHEWDLQLVDVINEHLPTHIDLLPPPPLWEDPETEPSYTRRKGLNP